MRMCHEHSGAHCCSPEDEPIHLNDPMTYSPEFRSALTWPSKSNSIWIYWPLPSRRDFPVKLSNFLWDHLWLFSILWGWIIVIFDKSRTFLQHYPQVNIQDIGYIKTGRWLWNILIPDPVLITFRPHRGRTSLILKTVPLAGQTSHLITSSLASFPPALTENLLLLFE